MSNPSIDVLVVGAGPTGLTLAAELTRHGLRVRIIDQNETHSIWSKAQITHARSLEIFADMGLADQMIERGQRLRGFRMYSMPGTKPVASVEIGGAIDSPYPFLLSISQRDTEQLLASRLEELGVPIERKHRLDSFVEDADGVSAVIDHGGERQTVRAAWLCGTDGARSTVRGVLGLAFEGSTYEQKIIQADVRIDLPNQVDDDEVIAFMSEHGIIALFPLPGERRYRMLVPILDDGWIAEPKLEDFQRIMEKAGPAEAKVSDPKWMVGFRIHCRMVNSYREGRVFLGGDAAHIHSPAGGQGMNTGIQDAYNLAWKLALVHRGKGRTALLDSYEAERLPIARATLDLTDTVTRGGLTALQLKSPLAIHLRNRLMGFVTSLGLMQERAARRISMLEIGYPNSPIVGQSQAGLLKSNVFADRSSEAPSFGDWLAFGSGPAPGLRAPDAATDPDDPNSPRLFPLFAGTHHTLLLFDGASASPEGYANLDAIVESVAGFGAEIQTHIIVPAKTRPAALRAKNVLLDPAGELHQRYGARSESLYLIRPDGYVGFRSQPADRRGLLAYLERIFVG